jgi:hypothetical protein
MAKKIVKILILVLGIIFIFIGIFIKDYVIIFRNAILLCLSCIGIQ